MKPTVASRPLPTFPTSPLLHYRSGSCSRSRSPYDEIKNPPCFDFAVDDAIAGQSADLSPWVPVTQIPPTEKSASSSLPFVKKLYHMINDANSQPFISWTELGTSFVVANVAEFTNSILCTQFKHNKFSSFVRQLNMYGFHKINRTPRAQRTSSFGQIWEFSHPKFVRGRPDMLEAIGRKALEPDPREGRRVELPGDVARLLSELREENRSLWREIRSLSDRVPQHTVTMPMGPFQSHVTPQPQLSLGGGHGPSYSGLFSFSNLGGNNSESRDDEELKRLASPPTDIEIGVGARRGRGGEEWVAWDLLSDSAQGGRLDPLDSVSNPLGAGLMITERERIQRLIRVIKVLVGGNSGAGASSVSSGSAAVPNELLPSILRELDELSLPYDLPPSLPMSNPSSVMQSLVQAHTIKSHSRSSSRDSQTHSNSDASNPTLSISKYHSPFKRSRTSPSPTDSEIFTGFGHKDKTSNKLKEPTLTMEPMKKRARVGGKIRGGSDTGKELDIVPSETEESFSSAS